MAKVDNIKKGGLIKGSVASVLVTLFLILIFAVVLKFFELNSAVIMPVNQVIKVISILIGVKVMLKNCGKNGLIRGMAVGLIYTLLSYLVFALLSKSFIFDFSVIFDVLFGTIIGGICGATLVNFKK